MHKLVEDLIRDLASPGASQRDYEERGLLLSLLVERHSKLRSPGKLYAGMLPEPYQQIRLNKGEYLDLVAGVSKMLRDPKLPTSSQNALVFILGATDDTTLQWTIPALAHFLSAEHEVQLQLHAARCLRKLLSEPDSLRNKSAQIRSDLPSLSRVRSALGHSLAGHEQLESALATVDKLARLLEP
jgi:hypothetical protein